MQGQSKNAFVGFETQHNSKKFLTGVTRWFEQKVAQSYEEFPNKNNNWAVVVAQLADRSLPTPEIRSSNPDIGIISIVKFIC